MSNADWVTARKSDPCPICEKDSWCVVSRDGESAICMRVQSEKPIAFNRSGDVGYLHRLGDELPQVVRRSPRRRSEKVRLSIQQVEHLQAEYRNRATALDVTELAYSLGVSQASILSFGVGKVRTGLYSFPMVDGQRRPIGLHLRKLDGAKFAETGSRLGAFVPEEMLHEGPLIIVEGVSDSATAYDLGFDVVGRPSCSACDDIVAAFCVRREVVIVADADDVGYRGANKLAACLIRRARSVRIITPVGSKDLRSWVRDGATRELIDMMAQQATETRKAGRDT